MLQDGEGGSCENNEPGQSAVVPKKRRLARVATLGGGRGWENETDILFNVSRVVVGQKIYLSAEGARSAAAQALVVD